MGLSQSLHHPCLFYGVLSTATYPAGPDDEPIIIGIYVDGFIYFDITDSVEKHFETILAQSIASLEPTSLGATTLPETYQFTCHRPPTHKI